MIPGFHIGSLLLHDQAVAAQRVAEMGFRSVAIRPRPGAFDPQDDRLSEQVSRMADVLARSGIQAVIDTDAPFMLDPNSFRGPSLASSCDRQADAAAAWIDRWIDLATGIGAKVVTFSSGQSVSAGNGESTEQSLEQFSRRVSSLASVADEAGIRLAVRPRHGDAIATVAQFERLQQWLLASSPLWLAADVGEMLIGHEFPVGDRLARNLDALACVYLCDHRSGVVGDQPIGHGDVAVGRIVQSLSAQGYRGPAIVRVDGRSELGLAMAAESIGVFASLSEP